jgi:DNA-binding transcriptional ArsR family regulator
MGLLHDELNADARPGRSRLSVQHLLGTVTWCIDPKYALTGIFQSWHIQPMVETFAALAEPNRFRIVELLLAGPRSVNDVAASLQLNQPQASKHLRVLKECGLVDVQPVAQQRLYELRAEPLRQLSEWLERYRQLWEARFEELDELVEELKNQEKSHDRDDGK